MFQSILPPEEPMQPEHAQPGMVYVHEKLKWEYKQVVRDLTKEKLPSEDDLNELGADGWEMSGVAQNPPFIYYYFKRLTD